MGEAAAIAAVRDGRCTDHGDPCSARSLARHLWCATRSCRARGQGYYIGPLDDPTRNRLQPLLADLASTLARSPLPAAQSALADVAGIVLGATSRHLDTLWPGGSLAPADNLARGAAVAAFNAIAADLAGAGFSGFTTADVVALVDAVVMSVADNPALMKLADQPLQGALAAMLTVLKAQDVARLNAGDVVAVVTAGLAAAARNFTMLQPVAPGAPMLLGGVLSAVFAAVASIQTDGSPAAQWQVASRIALLDIIRSALAGVAALPAANSATSAKLGTLESGLVQFFAAGRPASELPGAIAQALA